MPKMLLFCLLILSFIPQPTATPPLPKNGKIAFVARSDYSSGDAHIYRINPDGTDLEMFGDGECQTFSPQWSPDGKSFAYTSRCKGEKAEIAVWSEDVTTPITIKSLTDFCCMQWSPDGRKILVEHNAVLFVADSTGSNLKEVSGGEGSLNKFMSWLPDSKHVLFYSDRNYPPQSADVPPGSDRFLVNVETLELVKLRGDIYGRDADFTQDGKLIALSGKASGGADGVDLTYTRVYSVITGGKNILEVEDLLFEIDGWYAQWSPNEDKIVLILDNNIAIVDKDGQNLQVLTEGLFTKDVQLSDPAWQPIWND